MSCTTASSSARIPSTPWFVAAIRRVVFETGRKNKSTGVKPASPNARTKRVTSRCPTASLAVDEMKKYQHVSRSYDPPGIRDRFPGPLYRARPGYAVHRITQSGARAHGGNRFRLRDLYRTASAHSGCRARPDRTPDRMAVGVSGGQMVGRGLSGLSGDPYSTVSRTGKFSHAE